MEAVKIGHRTDAEIWKLVSQDPVGNLFESCINTMSMTLDEDDSDVLINLRWKYLNTIYDILATPKPLPSQEYAQTAEGQQEARERELTSA